MINIFYIKLCWGRVDIDFDSSINNHNRAVDHHPMKVIDIVNIVS